jgi:FtsP/CotA-like multicopper oxidase with cupredoxin domain
MHLQQVISTAGQYSEIGDSMKRRDFLKYSGFGIAGILVGCSGGYDRNGDSPGGGDGGGGGGGDDGAGNGGGDGGGVNPPAKIFNVSMAAALFEMIDGETVFMWSFTDPQGVPRMPGPVFEVTEGEVIRVNVTNTLTESHAFAIPGVAESSVIAPGATVAVTFTAPAAGTYLYLDPLNAPVNRVLGLHGPLVVLPRLGNTPYSAPTPSVQQLFDDLGTTAHFPRHALSLAGWQHERTRIWLMHQIDPAFNVRVQNGETIAAAEMRANFLPRYFTINGRSGVFASHDPQTTLVGRIGQPMLVRILNAGLYTHSLHLHANHFYLTAVNNAVRDNVFDIDSIHLFPEDRMDWLVPFVRPPDIPGDQAIPLRTLIPEELALVFDGVPQSPLGYPMHCHMEVSQTAAGGNYPQGTVTHIEFLGDLDGVDYPH